MSTSTRFNNRTDNYVKYRPHYPEEIIAYLENKYQISTADTIADIGAGTGISSELFLKKNYSVIAIEPNIEMQNVLISTVGKLPNIKIINGSAEHTQLENKSVNVIVCAQAFHWFDRENAKLEFSRILQPNGIVVLIWNERAIRTPFEFALNALIEKHAIDYKKVQHRNIQLDDIADFFAPANCALQQFTNAQDLDYEGLKGRLLSSSYMPLEGSGGYDAMIHDIRDLFERFEENNTVRIHYDTKIYSGYFPQ